MAAEFVRDKIRETVKDPRRRGAAVPEGLPDRDQAPLPRHSTTSRHSTGTTSRLVDVKATPIEEITPSGLRTVERVLRPRRDRLRHRLRRHDRPAAAHEHHRPARPAPEGQVGGGPRTYLGLTVAGFPNLFMITGPGSPSVLASMITAIEQHVEWIADTIVYLARAAATSSRPPSEAEEAWVDARQRGGGQTLYKFANSWYLGANIPGKPRVFMPYVGGFNVYAAKCQEVVANGYEGFVFE